VFGGRGEGVGVGWVAPVGEGVSRPSNAAPARPSIPVPLAVTTSPQGEPLVSPMSFYISLRPGGCLPARHRPGFESDVQGLGRSPLA
jgi:hypothetical protein